MTLRACLRLLLLAAMLLAPVGRIGMAQAMASHCAGAPAATQHHGGGHEKPAAPAGDDGAAIDCMIACAAMVSAPAPLIAPPAPAAAMPSVPAMSGPTGITPEADPPPPRRA